MNALCTSLLRLRILRAVLLLVLGVFCGQGVAVEPAVDRILECFPNAVQAGKCLLFRAYDCKMIALEGSTGVAAIFVRGKSQDAALEAAQKMVSRIGIEQLVVRPFEGKEPSVVVVYKEYGTYTGRPPGLADVIFYSQTAKINKEAISMIQFIGWRDNRLVMRYPLELLPGRSKLRNKKWQGLIEIVLDITRQDVSCAELRVIRFNDSKESLRSCFSQWLFGIYGDSEKGSRKIYGYEVFMTSSLIESTSRYYKNETEYALYAKNNQYLAGKPDEVWKVIAGKRKKAVKLPFPEKDDTPAGETGDTATDSGKQPAAVVATAPQPEVAPSSPSGELPPLFGVPEGEVQTLAAPTQSTAPAAPIPTAPAADSPTLTPQQALQAYLEKIKGD